VKLISGDTGIAGGIQVTYEKIHQVEEFILMLIIMLPVKPVNHVTPYQFILNSKIIVASAGILKLLLCV
jgi:hypothetical protein